LAIVEQRFKAADANHDGKLKIDEFTSAPGAALVKLITYQVEGVHPVRADVIDGKVALGKG